MFCSQINKCNRSNSFTQIYTFSCMLKGYIKYALQYNFAIIVFADDLFLKNLPWKDSFKSISFYRQSLPLVARILGCLSQWEWLKFHVNQPIMLYPLPIFTPTEHKDAPRPNHKHTWLFKGRRRTHDQTVNDKSYRRQPRTDYIPCHLRK